MTEEAAWLASLRPSRIREVQAGARSWTTIELIDIDTGQGTVLRSALETFGIRVDLFAIGQARHLIQALSSGPRAPYVILSCHGDDGSILIPELAPELERYQPFSRRVSPDDLRGFARFEGATVIATGCDTGDPRLAEAVLGCGASAYLAPTGAPFGYASFLAPVLLFYELTERRTVTEAARRLRNHDRELGMWHLYT